MSQQEDLPVNTDEEIAQVLALFEDKVMPVLDMAREIKGLDRVMNEPALFTRVPPYPGGVDNLSSQFRNQGIAPLIIARLAGSPQFEEVLQHYADWNEKKYDRAKANEPDGRWFIDGQYVALTHAERYAIRVARLEKLVKYLKEEVEPVV